MDNLDSLIRNAVAKALEEAAQEEVEKAKRAFEERIPTIVSGVALKLMQRVRLEDFKNEILIHVTTGK